MSDRVGQQLGNYRLTQLLGQGGFADVYLGEHAYLKTPAAIKVLQTRVTNDDLASFIQEAQNIARLVHPHIIRVFDFGVDGNTPFLVMDYAYRQGSAYPHRPYKCYYECGDKCRWTDDNQWMLG